MRRAIALVCVLTGCVGLGPRPDRTRFFTLSPLGSDAADAVPASRPALSLGLGPIVFPGYLDRMPIVRRTGANEVAISARDRWAEPLGQGFRTTLQQNLSLLLGTSHIVLYPWLRSARPDLAVDLEVLRFEAADDGDATVTAHWHVVRVEDGAVLDQRTSDIVERAGGRDTDAAVAALSRALGMLSRQIAEAVREAEMSGRDTPRRARPRG